MFPAGSERLPKWRWTSTSWWSTLATGANNWNVEQNVARLLSYCCCPWLVTLRSKQQGCASAPVSAAACARPEMESNAVVMGIDNRYEDAPGLHFSTIQSEEVDEVTQFLLEHFFTEEPLGKSLKVDPSLEIEPWLGRMIQHQIKEGLSIVVRDLSNDGNIVAVCLNDVERQQVDADDVTIFNSVDKEQHPNMWKIIHLLEDLVQGIDLFSRYKLDAYVVLQILCVNQTNGGRGLGRKLVHLTEILAKQLGHTLVISEATSEFSARAFLKAGFSSEAALSYADYKMDGQDRPFQDTGVHQRAHLMVKQL